MSPLVTTSHPTLPVYSCSPHTRLPRSFLRPRAREGQQALAGQVLRSPLLIAFNQPHPMRPRPILKTPWHDPFPSPLAALPFLHSPHVHFPPTPTLTDTRPTHSSSAYDRAPIVVSPNTCELPRRGERVYAPSIQVPAPLPLPVSLPLTSVHPRALPSCRSHHQPRQPIGSYFHPRAFEAYEHQREPSLERRQYSMASEAPQVSPRMPGRHPPSGSSASSTSSSSTTDPRVPDPYTYTELVPLDLPTYPYIPGPDKDLEFEVEVEAQHVYGSGAGTGTDPNPLPIPAETEVAKAAAARRRKKRDKYHRALYGGTGHGDVDARACGSSDLSLDGCLGGF